MKCVYVISGIDQIHTLPHNLYAVTFRRNSAVLAVNCNGHGACKRISWPDTSTVD